MIIAIDGPAGTGKSTIASMIAEKLNITFLNSGGFYRTLTTAILDAGIDYSDEEKTVEFCKKQKIEYTKESHFILNGTDITAHLHDDRVAKNVADKNCLQMNFGQFSLINSTIKSYLSVLHDSRLIRMQVENNRLYFFKH